MSDNPNCNLDFEKMLQEFMFIVANREGTVCRYEVLNSESLTNEEKAYIDSISDDLGKYVIYSEPGVIIRNFKELKALKEKSLV